MQSTPNGQPRVSRRRLLAAAGTTLAGSTAYLALAPDRAQAADVTATFTVPDSTYRAEEPPYTAWLIADGTWSYSGLEVDPTEWRITLRAGQTADNQDPLTTISGIPFGFDESSTFAMQAPLVDAAAFDSTNFAPAADGETKTLEVHSSVVFEVLNEGVVVVEATATGSGVLTVEDTTATYTASLDAAGSWDWQANATDPTPSL